jgi:hypothetical protein
MISGLVLKRERWSVPPPGLHSRSLPRFGGAKSDPIRLAHSCRLHKVSFLLRYKQSFPLHALQHVNTTARRLYRHHSSIGKLFPSTLSQSCTMQVLG